MIDEIYYFDGFGHGKHLFNGLIFPNNNNRMGSHSFQLDVLNKIIKECNIESDARLLHGNKSHLFKINDLSDEMKKKLISQFLSFDFEDRR